MDLSPRITAPRDPLPAHLVGTRQAIFHLIRARQAVDRAAVSRPAPVAPAVVPAAVPPDVPEMSPAILRDFLFEDRFVF